ncbi:SET domain-containing protein [Lachnellula hyalina]|uniref:SET domain-containing protein n=1 Tax=Lachnellula hyalina TaxID=1316788 RepID=A0A8H8R8S6_9HELO|nr:SET domain-containing protein [Lachnellula hyalina]TVY29671.1 SET domain-containing protein [Lachnellula hyalina]
MAEFGEPAMVEGTADMAQASVPVYDVRPAPGKGLGVFAKHHLKRGTPILIEKPAFSVPLPTEMFPGQGFKIEHMIASIEAGFESLSPDQKEEYLNLHEFHPSEGNSNLLMTIFTTNAYTMDDEHVGIFPKIARINHSCKPNTLNWWSVKTRRRIMYTSRDIEKDEEITVSYIPLLKTTMARQHRLKQYGFTCDCSACKSTEGDKRRVRMSDALDYLEQKQFSPTKKLSIKEKRISKSINLVNMLLAEGLPDYLAQAYHFAAVFNQQAGHLREAREWAMKELEMLQLAERGSEEALKAMEYLENLNT